MAEGAMELSAKDSKILANRAPRRYIKGKERVMIQEEQLDKFIKLCEESGNHLNREDALESALKLINLVKLIYQPMTKEEYLKIQERRKGLK